jgi:hypothetical protein
MRRDELGAAGGTNADRPKGVADVADDAAMLIRAANDAMTCMVKRSVSSVFSGGIVMGLGWRNFFRLSVSLFSP